MSALPQPDGVPSEPREDVTEMIRVWWNVDQPAMIIRPVLKDPAIVGGLLAELAWHFANAYAQKQGLGRDETLAAIRGGWAEAEQKIDTAKTEGAI